MKNISFPRVRNGFSIVELLVVIVIIGILATMVVEAYFFAMNNTKIATIKSDLSIASKKLILYYQEYGSYPFLDSSLCPVAPSTVDNDYCLKKTSGFSLIYTNSSTTFRLTSSKDTVSYYMTESSSPTQVSSLTCPTGFIVVPGSATYGTSDFCVMKYEAKDSGDHLSAVSVAAGTPWGSMTQPTAITFSNNTCSGCHLITDAERLTIAQNVMSVASNWTGGAVGSGTMYRGHSDNSPSSRLAASTNDGDGYYLTGNTAPSEQRRTLTLTNGEVIWDFAGNSLEWSPTLLTTGKPGIIGYDYDDNVEWNAVTTHGTMSPDPFPATAYAPAGSWNSSQGIGMLCSNPADATEKAYSHGGYYQDNAAAGIFGLCIGNSTTDMYGAIGFRVAK